MALSVRRARCREILLRRVTYGRSRWRSGRSWRWRGGVLSRRWATTTWLRTAGVTTTTPPPPPPPAPFRRRRCWNGRAPVRERSTTWWWSAGGPSRTSGRRSARCTCSCSARTPATVPTTNRFTPTTISIISSISSSIPSATSSVLVTTTTRRPFDWSLTSQCPLTRPPQSRWPIYLFIVISPVCGRVCNGRAGGLCLCVCVFVGLLPR